MPPPSFTQLEVEEEDEELKDDGQGEDSEAEPEPDEPAEGEVAGPVAEGVFFGNDTERIMQVCGG